jgi:hypothetical protein
MRDGKYIEGCSKIYRVFFDGITPSSVAAQYIEMLGTGEIGSQTSDGVP